MSLSYISTFQVGRSFRAAYEPLTNVWMLGLITDPWKEIVYENHID